MAASLAQEQKYHSFIICRTHSTSIAALFPSLVFTKHHALVLN